MFGLEKPQVVVIVQNSLHYTPYDIKWIPSSARFVVLGQHARGTGALQVYELANGKAELVRESEKRHAIKCGTFGASSLQARHIATGDFEGNVDLYDLERLETAVWHTKGHDTIVNCIDGVGGVGVHPGPPEIVTGSRDGCVKVWDVRQKEKPVAVMGPEEGQPKQDAWAVAFGNSYNDSERMVCAGYDNGDVKMFDLRTMSTHWETNIRNGVCSIEFDRRDIKMNKLVVTGLESAYRVYDLRTKHPKEGYASVLEKTSDNTTVWTVKHLPQNRDIFITSGGNGSLNLYKYSYPANRSQKDADGKHEVGVPGKIEHLNQTTLAEQPISSLDWSQDKQGLCAFVSFDQMFRVAVVTKLNRP
ncbi:WD repeat-containing protein 92 [Phlyctochytrium planicorne]|nr:WD repeat-containing protein 92 [Phlyctochytrium planicorne]